MVTGFTILMNSDVRNVISSSDSSVILSENLGKNLYPSILAASAELFMNVIIPLSLEQALVTVVQQWS